MHKKSILLVEDDDNDVFFFQDALRRSGVQVPLDIANDGQQAIERLAPGQPSAENKPRPGLVLLDLKLPRHTGFEVLQWIRQEPMLKTLVVIILTSSTLESDVRQAYLLGANSYLIKPTNTTRLREMIGLMKSYWLDWNRHTI